MVSIKLLTFVTVFTLVPCPPLNAFVVVPSSTFSHSIPSRSTSSSMNMIRRGGRPQGPVRVIEQRPPMNEDIKYPKLRVVTQNPMGKDEPVGIMTREEGLVMAKEVGRGFGVVLWLWCG